MQRYFFCLLLLWFSAGSLIAQPQQTLSEISTELSPQTQAYSFVDETGVTLLFREPTQTRLFLLDAQMQLTQSYTLDFVADPAQEILGFTNRPEALYLYFREPNEDAYLVQTIFKGDGHTENARLDLRENRSYLHSGAFTYQGTLHILRMPRNSASLRLCKFESGGIVATEEINLKRKDFGEKVNYQLTSISPDSSLELSDTYFAGKMYQYGPFLYLTLDEAGSTYVVSRHLTTQRQFEQSYPAPRFAEGISFKSNSLLWQDLLLQFASSADSLKLQIRDLRSGAIMKAYQYGKADRLDLMNGSILHQTPAGGVSAVPDLEGFLALAEAAPYVGIAARNLPDSLLIFVAGAIRPVQERGVSGIVLGEKYEQVWFESQFDLISLSPALPLASSPRWPGRPLPRVMETQFQFQGKKFQGYYDPRTQRYKILF